MTDVNEVPTIALDNMRASMPENTAVRTKVADIVVTDDALGDEALSLSGADASLFERVCMVLGKQAGHDGDLVMN